MWSDNETSIDYLGFSVHEQLIRNLVTNDALLPVTIGVFGDWGGGKSSVLRMLQEQLDGSDDEYEDVACLYFSGWMFEGYDDAKSALITSILMQLGEHQKIGPKIRDKVTNLLKLVDLMRLARLAAGRVAVPATGLLVAAGLVDPATAMMIASAGSSVATSKDPESGSAGSDQDLLDEAIGIVDWQQLKSSKVTNAPSLGIREFRERFTDLVEETGLRSLVILIDDLDRCSPERLVENLEAIKLFLAVPKTAFVIAADNLIVRHAISSRYNDVDIKREQSPTENEPARDLVTDYVEKLIQIPYHLPKLSPNEIETYITLLFCKLHLTNDETFDGLLAQCNVERLESPDLAFGQARVVDALKHQLPEVLAKHLQWSSAIAPALAEGLKGNPRQVKRFLNALLLRKELSSIARLEISDDVLVKLMLLEYSNYNRFIDIYKWQAASFGRPPQLASLEQAARGAGDPETSEQSQTEELQEYSKWKDARTQEWLKLNPPLEGVDLRDYFWIARDRLQGSVSGLSLLSLRVRKMLDQLLNTNPGERSLAARAVKEFEDTERADILRALQEKYQRQPEDAVNFETLVALVDEGVVGALDALLDAAGSVASPFISPPVGFELDRIKESSPEATPRISALFDRWESAGGRIGAAVKEIRATPTSATRGRNN